MCWEEFLKSIEIWSSFNFLRNQELPEVYKLVRNMIRYFFFLKKIILMVMVNRLDREKSGDSLLQDKCS